MKYTIGATISLGNYSNIQPSIEVEAETFEEANAQAMPYIEQLWAQYGEKPMVTKSEGAVLLTAFAGGDIYYDDATHTYTNKKGEKYLSGSQYAKQFERPFDAVAISEKMAEKAGVRAEDIRAMWELKSNISTGFGTAIHAALELYGAFGGLAKQLSKDTHIHDHPVIKKAVEEFYEGRDGELAVYEALVVDHAAKRAGRIDRLLLVPGPGKNVRVQDYKTNASLTKVKIDLYWKQLGFYAEILEAAGFKVTGLDIFAWNGEWKTYSKELIKEKA